MSGRRHGVVVRPLGRLLAMHVLHDAALVRPAAPLEAELRHGASSPAELNLACMLIDSVFKAYFPHISASFSPNFNHWASKQLRR